MSTAILTQLREKIAEAESFAELSRELAEGVRAIAVEGTSDSGKAALLATLFSQNWPAALVITYSDDRARRLAADMKQLLADREDLKVLLYPSIASALYDGVQPERSEVAQRLTILERLCAGQPTIVVACIKAVLHQTMPQAALARARRELAVGEEIDRDELVAALIDLGYERVDLVDEVGQLSARGGIIDISPPTSDLPVRVELLGNEIERLRLFDPVTQSSVTSRQRIGIGPAGEILLTEAAVKRAFPAIRSAFEREIRQLRSEEKMREAERLEARMEEDLRSLEQLRPTPDLVHYLPYIYSRPESLCDYLPTDGCLIVDEPVRTRAYAENFHEEVHKAYQTGIRLGSHLRLPDSVCMSFTELAARHLSGSRLDSPTIYLNMLHREIPWEPQATVVRFETPPVDSFGGKFDLLVEGLQGWQNEGRCVLICASEPGQVAEVLRSRHIEKLREEVSHHELQPGLISIADIDLSGGFRLGDAELVVLTGKELYGWRKLRRLPDRAYKPGFSLTSLRELHEGDYVVHINHGIGIYRGLTNQTLGGMEREYLVVEYADSDKLYVPVTQLDRIQKYIGRHGSPPITGLSSGRWNRAKKKARASTHLLARELMKLYAAREQAEGHQFEPDRPWLAQLENAFRYQETPDQLQAIRDVKDDMESDKPMDRLICGDVGFGKTEVAVRAAFNAVLDGKQVAVLVPTTVLGQQHHNTFRQRLSGYPVEIAMLSRFRSRQQQHKTIQGLKEGTVDIVIGTHQLLRADIRFKDLGLLVIDEEQRFGVKQKEQLKKLRQNVDVITLTATPIPRTLNMALSGVRSVSLINDPPQGRMPIRTFVRERDDELIREAILRELRRGGQVYFVHNRVKSIKHVAAGLQRLVPEAKVVVAHGQLPENELEEVMLAFYAEEFDVLVCTTIIENGLDVPNANTIIVDSADKLGLAQLYQLRGRVGRSDQQAYGYLLYRYPDRMSEEAEQRLKALEEFSELGSGFKLALRDLEIRGAGDILGREQSGHLSAVGLDLYCRMLADSVKTLKGERPSDYESVASIDLPFEALIPASYVPAENQRIALYRQLADVTSDEGIDELIAEMIDRYGSPPAPVSNLVEVTRLKLQCTDAGVADISTENGRIVIRLSADSRLNEQELEMFRGLYKPTKRQARRGARSKLPRASFAPQQLCFGHNQKGSKLALAAVKELIGRLADRSSEKSGQPQDAAVTSYLES